LDLSRGSNRLCHVSQTHRINNLCHFSLVTLKLRQRCLHHLCQASLIKQLTCQRQCLVLWMRC
jgi:hypothetical protein